MCEETCGEEKMLIPSETVLLDSCNLPDMGSRSKIYVLCKKQVLLTDEPYVFLHFYHFLIEYLIGSFSTH